MALEYIVNHVGLLEDDRYLALSWSGRAAWHTLMLNQARQPGSRFRSEQHVATILRKEGCPDPAAMLVELLSSEWLVQDDAGWSIRGFDRWQLFLRKDADRAKRNRDRARSNAFERVRPVRQRNGERNGEYSQESTTNEDDELSSPVLAPTMHDGPHDDCARSDYHVHVPK